MERRLGPGRLAILGGILALGGVLFAAAANAGSIYQGCDQGAGTIFMDGQPGDVDHVVAGYNPATHAVYVEGSHSNSGGTINGGITCQSFSWNQFSSNLRDKNDVVRADAYAISDSDYGPLPASMKTMLQGGTGADRIVGHAGPDAIIGGIGKDVLTAQGGNDVVRAEDGYVDTVRCGPGHDRAVLDHSDTQTGCEMLVFPVRPSH